jgi:hypothetical protein
MYTHANYALKQVMDAVAEVASAYSAEGSSQLGMEECSRLLASISRVPTSSSQK